MEAADPGRLLIDYAATCFPTLQIWFLYRVFPLSLIAKKQQDIAIENKPEESAIQDMAAISSKEVR